VKRLIVLLIVLAGGLAAAALAVPSNAATVNGTAISQQQLNSDLTAIAGSPDYQCFLNAEEAVGTDGQSALAPVDGVSPTDGGHATITTGFAANYLDTEIGHELVLQLAAARHTHLTAQELSTARSGLEEQITGILQEVSGSKYECGSAAPTGGAVLATMPSSFVTRSVRFDATVNVLEEELAGVGSSTADLEAYFDAHAAKFDTACFTVAEYASEGDAETAAASVVAGTPFSQVAAQVSGGGPQGCQNLYGVASELPALGSLPVDKVSSPIAEDGAYLLVQITSKSPTSFAKARTEVQSAVQSAGATKTRLAIDALEKRSQISVDGRYGKWVPAGSQVVVPSSPLSADVLNPTVNSPATVAAAATTPATGQTP
jgi:hypothetical protein